MKHLEIKSIEHKGINVLVKIDYKAGTISLVEEVANSVPQSYQQKKWVFGNREVEYMAGWQDIFDALKFATKEAEKDLRAHQKEQEDKAVKMVDEMQVAVAKIGAKHNKKNK